MQEPTHILTGVIIQRSVQRAFGRGAVGMTLTAMAAFLSHGLLDRLANFTYHPPQADFHDPFWVAFHSCVLIATIVFLCMFWPRYKWGVFFAMLPDFDWIIIKGQDLFHLTIPFYRQPHLHHLLGLLFDKTPPFSWVKIPNHRHNPWACLYEVGLVIIMFLAIRRLDKTERKPVCE